jgi:D-alanine transfer protein
LNIGFTMASPRTEKPLAHLFSGMVASGLAAVVLLAAGMIAVHREHATIHATAPELFTLKNQGLAFQRAAACAPSVLPFYGSSELTAVPVPERANIFFRTAPTGFQVSPVGAGGMPPLIISQKIAALGSDLRGKKLVISLSPGLTAHPARKAYDANFSLMAASEMVFGTALDFKLKRQIASRMLESPRALDKNPLLGFAVRRLASHRWFDRVVFCVLWPIGKVQNAVLEMQDHFAALGHILHKIEAAPQQQQITVDWSDLIAKANAFRSSDENKDGIHPMPDEPASRIRDVAFRTRMDEGEGWIEFELLLRTLASVHARPLLLSMPIAGRFYDQTGISREARETYYKKLRTLAQRYHFALIEFKGHDEDPAFLYRHQSHLTAKGWIYYDRALDDFFQGRGPHS